MVITNDKIKIGLYIRLLKIEKFLKRIEKRQHHDNNNYI